MMLREIDPKQGFTLGKVKLRVTKDKLVSQAGLGTIVELFDSSPLSKEFARCLPRRISHNSQGAYRLGLILISSLIHGDDCLDDIEAEFSENPSAEVFFRGKVPVAKTFGDFLRDFSEENIESLSKFLTQMGYSIRGHLNKNLPKAHTPNEKPTFSVDSTVHEQHGDKIEGCDYNYNGVWCLNSEVVYDKFGIGFAGRLQTGTTKPGKDGPTLLDQVLSHLRSKKISTPFEKLAHVNGDSAYGFEEFIRVAQSHHATFTIAARRNIPWEAEVEHISVSNTLATGKSGLIPQKIWLNSTPERKCRPSAGSPDGTGAQAGRHILSSQSSSKKNGEKIHFSQAQAHGTITPSSPTKICLSTATRKCTNAI
jgi:hypothetical protein